MGALLKFREMYNLDFELYGKKILFLNVIDINGEQRII